MTAIIKKALFVSIPKVGHISAWRYLALKILTWTFESDVASNFAKEYSQIIYFLDA